MTSPPFKWLWVFNPMDASVHLTHNEDRHPAHHVTHKDIAPEATHPGRLEGYAFHIGGGWRIMTIEGKVVDDPYITEKIRLTLNRETR